jgi:hypothetical protein
VPGGYRIDPYAISLDGLVGLGTQYAIGRQAELFRQGGCQRTWDDQAEPRRWSCRGSFERRSIEVIGMFMCDEHQISLGQFVSVSWSQPRAIRVRCEERIAKDRWPAGWIAKPKARLSEPPELEASHPSSQPSPAPKVYDVPRIRRNAGLRFRFAAVGTGLHPSDASVA